MYLHDSNYIHVVRERTTEINLISFFCSVTQVKFYEEPDCRAPSNIIPCICGHRRTTDLPQASSTTSLHERPLWDFNPRLLVIVTVDK
jgi:hypothetical protein